MEQELELAARAESHRATQRKTARTNQTLPVSRDTKSCQIERGGKEGGRGRDKKPGKRTEGGKMARTWGRVSAGASCTVVGRGRSRGGRALIDQPNWGSVTLSKMRKGEKSPRSQ